MADYRWMTYDGVMDGFSADIIDFTDNRVERTDGLSKIIYHEISYTRNGRSFTAWIVSTGDEEEWRLPTPSEARWLNTRKVV